MEGACLLQRRRDDLFEINDFFSEHFGIEDNARGNVDWDYFNEIRSGDNRFIEFDDHSSSDSTGPDCCEPLGEVCIPCFANSQF